ncbi:MAG: glutathione peroxidase [Methylotenera sp.]|nr:glutathione peroxidase [Methylotenera sp.]
MPYLFAVLLFLLAPIAHAAECPALLNHQLKTLQGKALNLCDYQGKPILVVNTASKCGFTPQFDKLEGLYSRYKDQGLLVVGFPSNDFKQELSNDAAIGDFCRQTYGVKFPMVTKSTVVGSAAIPFYKALASASGSAPKWNFHKYVISADGKTVKSFNSTTQPDDPEIMQLITPALK